MSKQTTVVQRIVGAFGLLLGIGVGVLIIKNTWPEIIDQLTVKTVVENQKGPSSVTDDTEKTKSAGAIARAVAKASEKDTEALKEEALQHGIYILSSEVEKYKLFKNRLIENKALAEAFEAAKNAGVYIFLGNRFDIGAGWIVINIDIEAGDEEIIDFVSTAVPEVAAIKTEYVKLAAEAAQFGIYILSSEVEKYKLFKNRLIENKALAEAFEAAKNAGVYIFLWNWLDIVSVVGRGWITIDVNKSDQEIIEFLLGD